MEFMLVPGTRMIRTSRCVDVDGDTFWKGCRVPRQLSNASLSSGSFVVECRTRDEAFQKGEISRQL